MLKRLLTTVLTVVAIAGFAKTSHAQYMWLDSNGDGVNNSADALNGIGVPTTVDVYLDTNNNKDGSVAVCNTGDGQPLPDDLDINSYVVNLALTNGTATFTNFINEQAGMTNLLFPATSTSTLASFANGSGAFLAPGTYFLMRVTCTLLTNPSGLATLNPVGSGLSPDPTLFGTHCSGNDFVNSYALGPNVCCATDWTDTAGLAPPIVAGNTAPTVNNPGARTTPEGVLLAYTVTATDTDVPAQTLTFTLGAGAPAGAAITPGGAFTWTPTEAQGPGTYPVTYTATDNGTPPLAGQATNTITVTEVNQAPVVTNPGNRTTNELTLLAYTVTATDPDLPANTFTFALGAGAPAGAAITAGGNFTWTPTEAQGPGTFPVTYNATDNGTPPMTGSATNTITVNEVNVAPVVNAPGNQTVNEGTLVSYTVTASDADLPGNAIVFTLGAGAPAGAAITTAGAFTWTPSEAQGPGVFPITYTATDNGTPPLAGSASNTITVNEVNVAPVVTNPGNRTTAELALLAYTVTATDADLPAQTLTFTLGAGAPAGAAITAGGNFTWTPTEAQGPGTFPVTYTATDNGTPPLAGSTSNTITVTEVNTAPVVTNPGPRTGIVGVLLTYTVTATDADLPANTIAFSLGAGAPAGAAITAGGVFSWTPSGAQTGAFPVTYVATDNGTPPLSGSATNTITVTPPIDTPPVVTNPGNKTTNELALLSYTVTATDPDVPPQTLTFTLGAGAPAGAAITAGGVFSWTPTEAQGPGTFPVTYVATDNASPPMSGSATNTITVTEVNVAPVVTAPANQTVNEGVLVSYTVTATDADLPANTLTFTLGAGAPAGAAITGAGAFTWTPSESQNGAFPITYTATDNGTPPLAGSASNTITVNEVNTAPVVTNPGNRTTAELALLSYTVTATDADLPAQTLTFTLGAGAPAGAAITAGGNFTWTPTEAQGPGTFPVTYTATDNGTPPLAGSATNTITVTEVNTAPVVANPGNKATNTGVPLSYTVTASDADIPANTITFSLGAGAPAGAAITAGGVFSWTPSAGQTGSFAVTYNATDNGTPPLTGSATNTITVGGGTAPVVTNPGNRTTNELALLSYTVTATDADVPAQTITFTLGAGAPAGAAITAGGNFTWTPSEAQGPGTFPVTYVATDNGTPPLSGSATNTITVNEVNVAPVVTAPANQSVIEGNLVSYTVTATDADLPANTLTFTLGAGAPAGAAITAGGAFTWTPSEAQGPGTFPITYTATDNGTPPLAGSASNTITIGDFNVAPVVTNPGNKTTAELALLSYTVTATDADIPAQTLTFTLGAGAPAGAAITAGGAFTWTPTEAQGPGTFPVTYTATDNSTPPLAGSTSNTITVTEVNVAPVVTAPANQTVNEGVLVSYTVTATDADLPANTLTFTLGAGAPAGAAITGAGAFTWTPSEAQGPGTFPITYTATDNGTPPLSGSASNTITVNEANNVPVVANPGNKTVNEGTLLAYTVTATDSDLPAQTITFSLAGSPPIGTGITPGGNFTWTPTEAQGPGTYPVTYNATDNGTPPMTGSATNTITVTEVNVAPVVTAPANQTVNEGVLVSYTVTATDADLPANTLTFTLGAGAPTGAAITAAGAFTWTPSEVQGPGTFPITYTATDNGTPPLAGSASNTITVNEVNTAPVVTNPGPRSTNTGVLLTYTVAASDADLPANTITFTLGAGAPAGAAITAGGVFTWTPSGAQTGTFPVTYVATDNGTPPLSGSATNTITVGLTNHAPTVTNPGDRTANEGVLLSYTVTATDPDAGQTIVFSLGVGNPPGTSITPGGNFTWTPAEVQGGATYPVTYIATDNGTPPLSGSATNTITVLENNLQPVVTNPGNKTTNEGVLLAYTVTATDADIPAQTITFTLGAGAPAGAAITAGGNFTWTPTEAQGTGTYPVTYVATDNGTPPMSGSATNTITVSELPLAPVVANPGNKTVDEGVLLAYTVTATDADLPPQTLTFTLGAGAPAGAAITAGGNFTWTPTFAQGGTSYPVTYVATDNGTPPLSGSATNTITVNDLNRAPTLVQPADMTVDEGATADQGLTASDPDGDALTFSKVSGPAFMTVTTLTPTTGNIHLAPGSSDAGSYPATVRASDGALGDSRSLTITVNNVNHAPTANAGGPYTGIINVAVNFNGSGSSDPDGDPLTYAWDFGDASTGVGATPSHPYVVVGLYNVTLHVEDSFGLSDDDATTANIIDVLPATAFTTGGNTKTSLGAGKPSTCFQIQPDGGFIATDVDLNSIVMISPGTGSVSQISASGKTSVDGDKNGDGITEVSACFSKDDMRLLWSDLPSGTTLVTVTFEGNLFSGGKFRATLVDYPVKSSGGGALAASIAPNPLNPQAILTFSTSKAGFVKVQMFDVQGRLVRTLADNASAPAGYHDITIDGMNSSGVRLASGRYFVIVNTADGMEKMSVTILK